MDVNERQLLDLKPLNEILSSTEEIGTNSLIPILQDIQNAYGYLPREVIMRMSERTRIPASRIYGVITFYEQFYLEPHGRHTIKCCRGTACHVKGAPNIADAIERVTNVGPGQTTDDMKFTFETVACLGTCFLAPVIMVDNDYYGHLAVDDIKGILDGYE
ncbi:MAG: NADH-quinone oxidoreductase subunit NuoE [Planctomycetota bacterium]|jgi:NADH-quinone oxidoreductase subunit E